MSILLSLFPFAVFFVLMRLYSPIVGLLGDRKSTRLNSSH